jgi:alpha-mannosidase
MQVKQIRRTQNGPFKAAIDVDCRIEQSDFTLTYELRAGDPTLYVSVAGTWFERGTPDRGLPVLRFSLPLAAETLTSRYEIPFGSIERSFPNGEEVPALRWAQVSGNFGGTPAGCLLLNDSKHGHSLQGNRLNLTLIRSSIDPDPLPDIGRHEIRLGIRPFVDMPVAEAVQAGRCFNHELRVVSTDAHAGDLPDRSRFVALEPTNVVLTGLKRSEDGEALLIRVCEVAGCDTDAEIVIDGALGTVRKAALVDLLETPTDGEAVVQGGTRVAFRIGARSIATVRVSLD